MREVLIKSALETADKIARRNSASPTIMILMIKKMLQTSSTPNQMLELLKSAHIKLTISFTWVLLPLSTQLKRAVILVKTMEREVVSQLKIDYT